MNTYTTNHEKLIESIRPILDTATSHYQHFIVNNPSDNIQVGAFTNRQLRIIKYCVQMVLLRDGVLIQGGCCDKS